MNFELQFICIYSVKDFYFDNQLKLFCTVLRDG